MRSTDTDGEWERFGRDDPYFGVLSDPRFRKGALDDEARAAFFASGEAHVDAVMAAIRAGVAPDFAPRSALDYGCGVGRIALPLSAVAADVTGADISPSMLAEARRNADAQGRANARFVSADELLAGPPGRFDFVHSHIVLQHINRKRGEAIFEALIGLLTPGGVGAIHISYAHEQVPWPETYNWVTERVPYAGNVLNLLRGKRFFEPVMHMTNYDLRRIFRILDKAGVDRVMTERTNHGGSLGLMLYFSRP